MKLFSLRKLFRCAAISAAVAAVAVATASSGASSARAAPAASPTSKVADSFGWQFDYDDAGRVARVTDPAGRDTRFQYSFDVAKRLRKIAQIRATEPSVTREFDEAGRLQSMTDAAGAVAYGYNERGRLNRVQRQGAPAVTYGYDTRDRITRLQVGDFYRVEYTYDFLGRLASMKTPAGVVQYEYATGQGSVVRTLPNGIKTIWEYEPNGRLGEITHADARNAILAQYTYQFRADGRIAAIRELSGGQQTVKSYEYDTVGRLIKASGPSGQHTYEYDAVGNRTKATTSGKPAQTYTYDWAGRLTAVDGKPTEHDAAGNLTSLTMDGSTVRYRHNQDGQLAEVVDAKVSYRYDGDGNLMGRNVGGAETTFVPDPMATIWRPLAMTGGAGQRTLVIWEGTTPLMVIRNGRAETLLHDHLGSIRLVADPQGKLSGQIDYEPFGHASKTAEKAPDFAPHFAGLFWDPIANASLTRARLYVPRLGRFLQMDPQKRSPTGVGSDLAHYAYSDGDPINLVDLDGNAPIRVEDAWGALLDRSSGAMAYQRTYWSLFKKYVAEDIQFAGEFWKGVANPPLVSGTERPEVLNEITALALELEDGDVLNARDRATRWRYGDEKYPGRSMPTYAELSTAENSLTAGNLADVAGGSISALGIEAWRRFKFAADMLGYSPAQMNKYTKVLGVEIGGSYWQPTSDVGLREQHRWKTKYSKPFLQVIDDFLCPPAYGDEVLGMSGSGDFGPQSLILASTTGPGKRGGRGGGTTRPPSWLPPGSQGRPPPGPQPPLGGKPPPGSNDAGRLRYSPTPSPVGGVYLAGAGQSLAGTGLLEGIAFDRNNNLVLVGKGGSETKLPPLRLDDVVTIFRSVYLHGEGPTVTIDPSPENPEGSAMIIRHGKATENTYVGWVLYQADRLMKGHTLGIDNITTKEVTTSVPGYADVLNTIYFGGESPEKLRKQGHWERFWIVPAATRRYVAPKNELTLFDVPLEVKTQSMKWEKGALVDDVQAKSSPGALAFRQWFTANYDRIAGERFLTPPSESGISAPVPVFTELRRIALITAIAEKLRDQGVPLPFWMRDYDVRPVPFEKITPGLEVRRSKANVIARVYGGVNLSAADKDVKTYTAGREAPPASGADAVVVRQHLTLAGALEEAIRPVTAGAEPMQVRTLAHEGTNYQVASLPGAGTLALAPARLEEVDLMAPVPGRAPIRLARSYNSFFNPSGPWGKGWALELPRLDQLRLPVRRGDKGAEYQIAFELVTPLNSVHARFARVESVPALAGMRLQVPDEPGDFFGVADARPEFLSGPTQALLRKDGGTWHFSKSGELVAIEQDGSRVVYERDGKGRLTRIVGLLGRRPVATIELRYDAAGRIEAATAKAEQREEAVRYEYDSAGRLAAVVSDAGRVGYRYDGSQLTEVTSRGTGKQAAKATDTVMRRFQYGPRGRLVAEFGPDGARTEYRVTTDKNGSAVTAASAVGGDKSARADTVRYDPALRPVEATYADGTRVAWSYPPGGGIAVDLKAADGANIRATEAADQRSRTVELAANRKLAAQYDPAGRLTALTDNGQPVLRQTWTAQGRLLSAGDDTAAANFEYDPDGLLARVLLAPPGERGPFKTWQATRLDPAGRPVEVTDYRGLQASIDYDGTGELRAAVVKRDGKNYGFQIARDDSRRIREVKSSWGASQYAYDASGLLNRIEVESNGQKSTAEWKSGLLQKVRQFDGGEYAFTYYADPKRAGLPKEIIAPNRLALGYDYDAANRLAQVTVGRNYRLLLDYDANGRVKRWAYAAPRQ